MKWAILPLFLLLITCSATAQDFWTRKADLPGANRSGDEGFQINDKGYMGLGGRIDLWEYDPVNNSWTQKADFPGGARIVPTTMSVGDKGYVGLGFMGTFNFLNDWWEFDPVANNWTQKGNFPGTSRYGAVTFSIGSKGYLGVGFIPSLLNSVSTMDFWQYDPVADHWTKKAPFPAAGVARQFAAGFSVGGKGYLGTGTVLTFNQRSFAANDFYEYDPIADSWTRKKDFPGQRRSAAVAFAIGERGYLGLGQGDSVTAPDNRDFWEYNPLTDTWKRKADFGGGGRVNAQSFVLKGKGYVGLGSNNSSSLSDLWQYSPAGQDTMPPMVQCPPSQHFGPDPCDQHKIPLLTATDADLAGVSFAITGATNRSGTGRNASGTFIGGASMITFTATDSAGNTASCQTTVVVDKGPGDSLFSPSGPPPVTPPATTHDGWTRKADVPGGARYNPIAFSVSGKGYIGGGGPTDSSASHDLWAFDPATNTWTQKADLPGSIPGGSAMTIGNKVYAGMGPRFISPQAINVGTDWWEYDPAANSYTQKTSFPGIPRNHSVTFSIGSKGYLGTGTNNAFEDMNDFWEYDPDADIWTGKASFPGEGSGRPYAAGFSIGNKGYLGTGVIELPLGRLYLEQDFYEYDPAMDAWTRKHDFPGAGRSGAVAFSTSGRGYLGLGSEQGATVGQGNDFWEYNPATDSWTRKTDFPGGPAYDAKGLSIGGKGYVAPGSSGSQAEFWQYSRDTTPPTVVCPPAQTLCFNNCDIYNIPLLGVAAASGIAGVSYSITGATNRSDTGINATGAFIPGNSLIKWTVTDSVGNTATCQTPVRVNKRLMDTIPDIHPLVFWGPANTLYEGFGSECATLFAEASGGTPLRGGKYNYLWSNGSTNPYTRICPERAGVYTDTVTVTDSLGCRASAFKTITVIDVRCGHDERKVAVCVTDRKRSKTLCLPYEEAVFALLFGAHLGSCPLMPAGTDAMGNPLDSNTEVSQVDENKGIAVFPNPNNGVFTLQLSNISSSELRIIDQNGRVVARQIIAVNGKRQALTINVGNLPVGTYAVQAIGKDGVYTCKMMVQR